MKAVTPIIFFLIFSTGCGALWSHEKSRKPVAPTSTDSDLVFVRTGDRAYYYIVDTRRQLCFFHSTLYGKKHLVEMPCDKLPEYQQVMAQAGVTPRPAAPRTAPAATVTAPKRAPVYRPGAGDVAKVAEHEHRKKRGDVQEPVAEVTPAAVATGGLTNEDRNAFRRAWVQRFCARRAGQGEALDTLLARHGLDVERWDTAKAEFSSDRDLWSALTGEAMDTCP
jgi:hypothetical protein